MELLFRAIPEAAQTPQPTIITRIKETPIHTRGNEDTVKTNIPLHQLTTIHIATVMVYTEIAVTETIGDSYALFYLSNVPSNFPCFRMGWL